MFCAKFFYFILRTEDMLCSDILREVLLWVDPADLPACRAACSAWRAVLGDLWYWRERCAREGVPACGDAPTDWQSHYLLTARRRNLVANPSGEDGMRHWVENSVESGFYANVMGVTDFTMPPGASSYFSSWNKYCMIRQRVDLVARGYSPALMDAIQPAVEVQVWHSAPLRDVWCDYFVRFRVLDARRRALAEKEMRVCLWKRRDGTWSCVRHVFRQYGPSARYVEISHMVSAYNKTRMGLYSGVGVSRNSVEVVSPWAVRR
ncbi:putative F-box-containing protein [Namao virus]|nr:putative F-box-containing protein [Namao virus]